jgi:pSer/pThr/pTyr-binding forkhead associated (FHA) protein
MNVICTHCAKGFFVPDSAFKLAVPNIKCPFCKTFFKPGITIRIKMPEGTHTQSLTNMPNSGTAKGWLVVHDEKANSQTFDLKLGKQVIGRKSETRPCDIMIDCGDPYMSRNHFVIEVVPKPGNILIYALFDSGSKNHTFINTKELDKSTEVYYLQDNDTIQAGETKIVFRNTAQVKSAKEATQLVTAKEYLKTVLIR